VYWTERNTIITMSTRWFVHYS